MEAAFIPDWNWTNNIIDEGQEIEMSPVSNVTN